LNRLPAVADNAAMQAEPLKAEPPKRKRRWFQFSLRTLLIGVTLLAVACGFAAVVIENRKLIRERDEAIEQEAVTQERLNKTEQSNRVLINQLHQIYREQGP
jgi:hypothetical protein